MDPDLDTDTYQDQEPAIFVIDLTDSKKNNLFLYFSVPIFQIVQLRNFTNIKSLNKSKNCSNPILIWDAQKKVEGGGEKSSFIWKKIIIFSAQSVKTFKKRCERLEAKLKKEKKEAKK
jgi:hypothetical protein